MPRVVILGGGIIGLSTAYYLSTSPRSGSDEANTAATDGLADECLEIHIVEASPTLFDSASGHAAGFLAKDWFAPAVALLGGFSFNLYRQLAEQHDGREKWGWSESLSYSLDRSSDPGNTLATDTAAAASDEPKTDLDWLMNGTSRTTVLSSSRSSSSGIDELDECYPSWLRAEFAALQPVSERTTTGQVDPLLLCQFLLEQCLAKGVILHHPARATRLVKTNPEDPYSLTSIHLEVAGAGQSYNVGSSVAREISCDSLVIAAGCWTHRVYRTLFPNAGRIPRVTSLAGHSLILKSGRWPKPSTTVAPTVPPCHAIFTSDPSGFSPEMFSRAGGDIWLGGLNSSTLPLPNLASDAHGMISRSSIQTLTEVAKTLCGNDVEVTREGLCFRPVSATGNPIIAKMDEHDLGEGPKPNRGVFVATGHGPWGISLSLGTGYVVSEMVLGKEPSVNVAGLSRWEA